MLKKSSGFSSIEKKEVTNIVANKEEGEFLLKDSNNSTTDI